MTAYAPLRALFADAGYAFVEPPILHAADVFVELAGEDLRRRLFLTTAADGREMALRPDYTIPVCLHHLAGVPARRRAGYAYLGPVFRQRSDEASEFLQAGVESLGRTDRVAADADMLKLALAAVDCLGVRRPIVRIGDSALFAALLDRLDLSRPWRRRLARTFGDASRLRELIARAADGVPQSTAGAAAMSRAATRKKAAAMLAATGLGTIGGRTADEIAERMVEKTALAAGIGVRPARILGDYLDIVGPPAQALKEARGLFRRNRLDAAKALDGFEARLAAFAARDIDLDGLAFAADFGRRLDYYTGFVFEMHASRRRGAKQIVGGGRYDSLVALIGDTGAVPAVGFAVWLDRIANGGDKAP
ncbi:MAG: ATP phosphoribosyltransferase regulatory subunit [Bauldia sp.]|uniref:ATP phosphoribosyltransferase regulatory subunit n=1 Tax=Bauldia sp. TaxID=2575872 RepID=UPI001DFFD758|nr:ATP phosphoribosyltransferase regulatory subunit [Bauldia sp.]MCB1494791.1 ATP phosphoribosyltransferase regulatory subunit [Bauldia sp.]